MDYVIAIDLGGTQLRAAVVDAAGTIITHSRAPTLVHEGPDAVIRRVLDMVSQVRPSLPIGGRLLGVGIGAPGPLDPETGRIYAPPNMPGWDNVPLRDVVATATGLPVALGNDANAAALAEWRFGGGRGLRHMVYVTVSTGIGGGVISDGRLLLGRLGSAAEVGFQILDPTTGAVFEDLASGTGIARAAAAAMPQDPTSMLHRLATPATVTAAHVSEAHAAGDPLAVELMRREARLLGIGFVNILHLFSPELILVGGSVALKNPWLIEEARAIAYANARVPLYREVPIELARLGEPAGILGAAALALEAFGAA
jgi:glucokinase